MSQILTDHQAIREWATARAGNPMLMEVPDGTHERTLLQLTFGQHAINAEGNEGPDRIGGFRLVSWDEWFAALEQNNLALRVSDDPSGGNEAEFEFVARDGEGETTDAAKKPASIVTEGPKAENRGG
ncbi:hypothetical protein IC608_13580 [Devosia sp. PTR5]|uniref:1,4-alpha-glucan branching enzyme n=1 Tax=Devosia oryzisoli TaxID=2774138 RepID=A0A927FVX0_9HYPH|nr:hypothetical protein [Devosia oryzisoli]MBD8066502.1 hypothetical protein [Devosia oryzisoli]